MNEPVVIGVGNPDRGDDGLGRAVARRLKQAGSRGATILESDGAADRLIEAFRGAERVILVDAAQGVGAPGSVVRLEAHGAALPAGLRPGSSHALGVAEAIELARALGELPPCVVVYAVEGSHFAPGPGLSAEVQHALDAVVERVLGELRCFARRSS